MSKKSQPEGRWLDSSESEIVSATRSPEIEQQSIDQPTASDKLMLEPKISVHVSNVRYWERRIHGGPSACRTMQVPWKKCGCYLKQFSALTGSFLAAKRMSRGRLAKPSFLAMRLNLRRAAKPASTQTPGARHLRGCTQKKERSCLRWERPGKKSVASRKRVKWRRRARTARAEAHRARTFEVGIDVGSPISLDYFDRRPYAFEGRTVSVQLK